MFHVMRYVVRSGYSLTQFKQMDENLIPAMSLEGLQITEVNMGFIQYF